MLHLHGLALLMSSSLNIFLGLAFATGMGLEALGLAFAWVVDDGDGVFTSRGF